MASFSFLLHLILSLQTNFQKQLANLYGVSLIQIPKKKPEKNTAFINCAIFQ